MEIQRIQGYEDTEDTEIHSYTGDTGIQRIQGYRYIGYRDTETGIRGYILYTCTRIEQCRDAWDTCTVAGI